MSIMGAAGLGAPAAPNRPPQRKASTIIAELLALADGICARPFSDAERAEELAGLANQLEELRHRRVEGPPFIGDAEDMLLMALLQVTAGDHPSDMRKKWAQIAGVFIELVQVSLGNAIVREARPVSTSESAEAEGPPMTDC
jgi:hypothetical protein